MFSEDRLSSNSTNSAHGKTSVKELRNLLLLHLGGVLGGESVQSEVTGLTLSVHGGKDGGVSDDNIKKSDPEKKLEHGS